MDNTFWLSVLALTTGFAGLVLHFWRYLQEKPRLSVYIPSSEQGKMLLGFETDYHQTDEYGQLLSDKSKCTFYQWIRISNQSEKPITVLEIKLVFGSVSLLLDSKSKCSGWIPIDNISSRSVIPQIQPIITLESYSAIEGYLFFGPANSIPLDGTKATLRVQTTRKIFKTKVHITVDRFNEELFELER